MFLNFTVNLNPMKLSRNQKFLLIVVVSIAIAIGVTSLYYYSTTPKTVTRYNFYETELQFRDDLKAAQNISVYPDEKSILDKVWDPDVTTINIAYVPTENESQENGFIALNVFEIRYKLDIAYHNPRFNWANEFTTTKLDSFENITQSGDTLVIALVSPSLADKTVVELDGNVVYIKGVTPKEFDLATIKFLMSALNIMV